jgi:hypothetical protein
MKQKIVFSNAHYMILDILNQGNEGIAKSKPWNFCNNKIKVTTSSMAIIIDKS